MRDVLVGEVWICSGQSNMEWKLSQVDPQRDGDPPTDLPRIRLLTITNAPRLGRQDELEGRWTPASERSLVAFSAVAGWFGRALHRELGVPIGLICNAWGGTRIQTWISREALLQDPLGRTEIRHYEGFLDDPTRMAPGEWASIPDWEARGAPKDTGNRGLSDGWAGPAFDDAGWKTMPMPTQWQQHGHAGSGVFWFRRSVLVPAAWSGRDLDLGLGAIDKHDETYVNGERVGGMGFEGGPNTWCTPRTYRVPGRLVPADGSLCIAVRVRSHFHHGGMIGPAVEMRVAPVGESGGVPLHGPWRYAVEQDYGVVTVPNTPWGPGNPNSPYILFDSRIAPLLPYAIRGAIWYQGESNAEQPEAYRRLMPLMIRDWRRAWGQGDFPFIQVQLANFRNQPESPANGRWPELREAQTAALAEPGVGMAVAVDIGDPKDIHPRNKRDVGERLARWALAHTYGREVAASGSLYRDATVEAGGRMRVRFDHGAGLRTRDGAAVGELTICGIDRVHHPAESRIEGDTLLAWSPQVLRPWAVRYAWDDCPMRCNLVNGAGLPASPFRSDGA
ncbi:MAG: 9-O-acetylesterase [Planctomycetes bacterium]|nr:9-O-acetylesterase [Planctomycetota bacterium]